MFFTPSDWIVMPALYVAGVHLWAAILQNADGRDKPGHP
jgi:hypothetical protein